MNTYEVWAVEVLGPDGWNLVQITTFEVNARKMIERKHHRGIAGRGKGTWHADPDNHSMYVFGTGVRAWNKEYRKDFPVYRYRRVTVS